MNKSVRNLVTFIGQNLASVLSPPMCAYCKYILEQRDVLCVECRQMIMPVVSHSLQITKTKSVRVFALSAYQDPIKSLIVAKTWSDRTASRQLGQLMWQLTDTKNIPFDFLVPIPLHWTRYAWRGYNQAAEIAHVLHKESGQPIAPLIKRVKRTQVQGPLSLEQRVNNMRDVFRLSTRDLDQYRDKHLLLVDDVMTSGATLSQAARVLFKIKPASISAVVACRVS